MQHPLLLGLDVGSSSVKASLVSVETGKTVAWAQSPAEEMEIKAPVSGWAEQDPESWWQHTLIGIRQCLQQVDNRRERIKAIGIAYQMHGLVAVDKQGIPVRPSIIWCDSRAVGLGEKALKNLGQDYCLSHFLNAPGNFTASKLKWVMENEPDSFERIDKVMLPGDYIAYKLTGEMTTTDTGLSEGIFWDYSKGDVADALLDHYGIDRALLAERKPVFSRQGEVTEKAAKETGLKAGTVIAYRAGDQPNNAFSLKVLHPGETAATAGTSGVIYSVTDRNASDPQSRVNTFLHVSNADERKRNGVLLCLNGTGILYSWLRKNLKGETSTMSYSEMNSHASQAPPGCDGVVVLPFGNGAERMLENKVVHSSWHGIDFNRHQQAHLIRAAQEGIAFAFKYGFEILKSMGLEVKVIRAGNANMFLSPLFCAVFANVVQVPLQLYDTDGAKGAALGAGLGAGIYSNFDETFNGLTKIHEVNPQQALADQYEEIYKNWKDILNRYL